MITKIIKQKYWIGALAFLLAALFLHQPAHAQTGTVTVDLCATTGSAEILTGVTIPVWGYTLGDCTVSTTPELPGPTLEVVVGDIVEVVLHNNLAEPTALLFQGQAMIPDQVGVAAGGVFTYTFTALDPGTFLYEAGLLPNAQHQVAMGMTGVLIVRPAGVPGQAYDDPSTAFTLESPLVLSEVDPALNTSADPAAFDMRDFAPQYWLINGKAYPDTVAITTSVSDMLLLRVVNAGLLPHSMGLLGLDQTLLAVDGKPFSFQRNVVVQTVAPGQTMDFLVSMPAAAPAGGGHYAFYDTNLLLHNAGAAGFGGMMTFVNLPDGGPPPGAGPTTTDVSLAPNPTDGSVNVTLTATIPGATSAEYWIDTQGTGGTGTPMTMGGAPDVWEATISVADLAGLAAGDHTFYVHGSDGVWGLYNFAILHLDKMGPMTEGIVLSPNPSNGTMNVTLSATGNDSMMGNSDVVAAEYVIDDTGAPATAMSVSPIAPIASLNAVIPSGTMAGLVEGQHTLYVRSQDAFGHWGPYAEAALKVDKSGPDVLNATVTPNLLYVRTSVRLDATLSDPSIGIDPFLGVNSNIKKVEGFINAIGADGTGFPLTPIDGLFNSSSEAAYATIPLATINSLPGGENSFYLHGQDSSGNWGTFMTATLTIMPENIFADGFESGFVPWTGTAGTPTVSAGAARPPSGNGMAVALNGTALYGYTIDGSPTVDPSYHARFYLNPNSTATGNNAQPDIFVGLDASNNVLFKVQYNRTNQGVYRVRAIVSHAGGTTTSGWVNINNGWNAIEIAWQSANAATFRLYTGGVLRQTLTGLNTSAFKLETVWLGPSGSLGNNVSGTMYFDDFVSKRTLYIGP